MVSAGAMRRSGWLSAVALAASVFAHLCLIAFLAWSIRPTQTSLEMPPIEVSLWSLRPARASAPRRLAGGARDLAKAVRRAQASLSPADASPPTLPLPAADTVHATDALRGLLRASVGCDHPAAFHLTADEVDQCRRRARRLGEGQPAFMVRPHDGRKLAAFDQAANDNDAERRAREGPMGQPIPVCSGPGSNFGGGCLTPHYKTGAQGTSEADQRSVWH